jgi:hypothetical protein
MDAVTAYRPAATTAGYSICVRNGRIYMTDQHPDRGDPRISVHEAKELAQRLWHAAATAERDQASSGRRPRPRPGGTA